MNTTRCPLLRIALSFHLIMLPVQAVLFSIQYLSHIQPNLLIALGALINIPIVFQGMRKARTQCQITKKTYWFGYRFSLMLVLYIILTMIIAGITLGILVHWLQMHHLQRLSYPISYALEAYFWACLLGSIVTSAFLKPYTANAELSIPHSLQEQPCQSNS